MKTTELATSRGFDGHKKIKGRKRHIVVDTLRLLLMVLVHDANLPDGKQAFEVLTNLFFWFFTIQLMWANGFMTTSPLPSKNMVDAQRACFDMDLIG